MAGVTIRANYGGGDSGGDPVKWFRGKVARIEDGSYDAMKQAMDDGRDTMKHLISTRGTEKSGKAGRIETGEMLNAVESSTTISEAGRITGRFGWLRNRENYFGFQEGGFEHVNGVSVPGMYAMVDSAELAFQEYRNQMDQVMRNA